MNTTTLSWGASALSNPPNVVSAGLEFIRGLSTPVLAALIFIGFPTFAIFVNAARQVVCQLCTLAVIAELTPMLAYAQRSIASTRGVPLDPHPRLGSFVWRRPAKFLLQVSRKG
jgi:polyferredoxin